MAKNEIAFLKQYKKNLEERIRCLPCWFSPVAIINYRKLRKEYSVLCMQIEDRQTQLTK